MSAADRLKQAITDKRMDLTTLARKLMEKGVTGGSRAQLHRYLSGEAKTDPPLGVLSEAAEILGVSKMWLAFGAEPVRWITESEGWSAEVASEVAEATPYFAHDPTLRTLLFDLLGKISSSIGDDRLMPEDVVRWAKLVQNIATYPLGTLEELHGEDSDAKEKARREFLKVMLSSALPQLLPPKAAATWVEPELMRLINV